MHPRALFAAAAMASLAVLAIVVALVWQPWESGDSGGDGSASEGPRLTLEGVLALVSAEHVGCPAQPALVLTADVVYDGEGTWLVTYGEHSWEVDDIDKSVRTIGEPLPCPER